MYYIHYDNNGRPDQFSGHQSRSMEKAIAICKTLNPKAYVSKLIDMPCPFTGKPSKGFEPYIFCNKETDNGKKDV